MPTYGTSYGERLTREQIEVKIRAAKAELIDNQVKEYGYNFCQECMRNDDKPLDCAHTISVKECLENGEAEKAWDVNNMRILGRRCHAKYDKLNIQSGK